MYGPTASRSDQRLISSTRAGAPSKLMGPFVGRNNHTEFVSGAHPLHKAIRLALVHASPHPLPWPPLWGLFFRPLTWRNAGPATTFDVAVGAWLMWEPSL